jgi:hypothetical protein
MIWVRYILIGVALLFVGLVIGGFCQGRAPQRTSSPPTPIVIPPDGTASYNLLDEGRCISVEERRSFSDTGPVQQVKITCVKPGVSETLIYVSIDKQTITRIVMPPSASR